uniref:Uncharacterized protein n=1 Tax=Arundo donax TaxID=35708 RepID=A0A0A8YAF4_ARUDO
MLDHSLQIVFILFLRK